MLVTTRVLWDMNWFLQLMFSALVVAIVLCALVKNTASRYFKGDHRLPSAPMPRVVATDDYICVVCSSHANKKGSICHAVRYCSIECQQSHWKFEHEVKCKDFYDTGALNSTQNRATNCGFKNSAVGDKNSPSFVLVHGYGTFKPINGATNYRFKAFATGGERSLMVAHGVSTYRPVTRSEKHTTEVKECKFKGKSQKDRMGDAREAWSKERVEYTLANTERFGSRSIEATSLVVMPDYSIAKCVTTLNKIEDVADDVYMKAVEKFRVLGWREIFLTMPNDRRRAWQVKLYDKF